MKQTTFADNGDELATKKTRKRVFLEEMNGVVPWARLVAMIRSYAPTANCGRPPLPIVVMLRIHFPQLWNNYSDPAMEEALHEMPVYRLLVRLDAGASRLPDESTIRRFRHFLEEFGLATVILSEANATLQSKGLLLKNGTAIDATLIASPSSPKKESGTRGPQMNQTKKGNQYYFGTKAHIGVDAESGSVHTLLTTPVTTHDITQAQELHHGQETNVFANSGSRGIEKREETKNVQVNWHIAIILDKRKALNLETVSGQLRDAAKKSSRAIGPNSSIPFG
jgi:IS5 family transposase